MRRFINGLIALIFAAAFIVGTFYLLDITRDVPEEPKSTGMTIETPVYDMTLKLIADIDDLSQSSEHFCTCVDDYVKECVTNNGGGTLAPCWFVYSSRFSAIIRPPFAHA